MFHQLNFILADDEIAVAFANGDGGGQTCGRDSGQSNSNGGRGCDKPSPNPQGGCDALRVVRGYGTAGAALCNAGANAIGYGNNRREAEINRATGAAPAKTKVAHVTSGTLLLKPLKPGKKK